MSANNVVDSICASAAAFGISISAESVSYILNHVAQHTNAGANYQAVLGKYTSAGQSQVFKFYESVAPEQQRSLLAELRAIDVDNVNVIYKTSMAARHEEQKLEPFPGVQRAEDATESDRQLWHNTAMKAVAANQVAVITMAGGQGTRLGYNGPKGEYDIGLPSHSSLFKLQADRMRRLQMMAGGGRVKWYIMTSPMTHAPTLGVFKTAKFFGLEKSQVFFFQQGTLPCMTPDGQIILQSKSVVAKAPDGNGGIYAALHKSGAIADMDKTGIKAVFVTGVDNAICRVADPQFVGYCLSKNADVGNKVTTKRSATEPIGVQCLRNGKPEVVEYSDIDPKLAALTDDKGRLKFSSGSVCIHYYSLEFLKNTCHPDKLSKVFHIAKKAIPFAHPDTGVTTTPAGKNGIKLESFIFDVFPLAQRMAVFEVSRAQEFSPVKNKPADDGSVVKDSPTSARQIILQTHRKWLTAAGAIVPDCAEIEISGLVSFAGENLDSFKGKTLGSGYITENNGQISKM